MGVVDARLTFCCLLLNVTGSEGNLCSAIKSDKFRIEEFWQGHQEHSIYENVRVAKAVAYNLGCENETCSIAIVSEEDDRTACCVNRVKDIEETTRYGRCSSLTNITSITDLSVVGNKIKENRSCSIGFINISGIQINCVLEISSQTAFLDKKACNPPICHIENKDKNNLQILLVPKSSIEEKDIFMNGIKHTSVYTLKKVSMTTQEIMEKNPGNPETEDIQRTTTLTDFVLNFPVLLCLVLVIIILVLVIPFAIFIFRFKRSIERQQRGYL